VSLAQREMLFGGQDVSAPLRVKMQMLSKFAGSLAEKVGHPTWHPGSVESRTHGRCGAAL